MPYTLDDLEEAKRNVTACQNRIDNHRANNPDYGRADLRNAQTKLNIILADLKARGILALTEQDELEAKLDEQFPNARSKEIVEYEGKRYQRRFLPAHKSRSGKTVMEWSRWWQRLDG
jgi:hypothetical protein